MSMSISEIGHSSYIQLNKQEKWEPNNRASERMVISDWRVRCTLLHSFQQLNSVSDTELATVGAPLLHLKPFNVEVCDKLYTFYSAHDHICAIQKSF